MARRCPQPATVPRATCGSASARATRPPRPTRRCSSRPRTRPAASLDLRRARRQHQRHARASSPARPKDRLEGRRQPADRRRLRRTTAAAAGVRPAVRGRHDAVLRARASSTQTRARARGAWRSCPTPGGRRRHGRRRRPGPQAFTPDLAAVRRRLPPRPGAGDDRRAAGRGRRHRRRRGRAAPASGWPRAPTRPRTCRRRRRARRPGPTWPARPTRCPEAAAGEAPVTAEDPAAGPPLGTPAPARTSPVATHGHRRPATGCSRCSRWSPSAPPRAGPPGSSAPVRGCSAAGPARGGAGRRRRRRLPPPAARRSARHRPLRQGPRRRPRRLR